MPVIGITGGVATGKSTFTRSLLRLLAAEGFDADAAVHALLESDPAVRVAIKKAFGSDIYDAEGKPDRSRLRELVFSDDRNRQQIEGILHPVIRDRWIALGERARLAGTWFVADIPLLYETGTETHCDRVVVVACLPATQRRRLECDRHLAPELAGKIILAQLDLAAKIKRADHLVWNDSTTSCLDRQADLFATWLRQYYG